MRADPSRLLLKTYVAAVLAVVFAPFGLLVAFAFNTSRFPYWPWQGFSTRWFAAMADDALWDATLNSVKVATASAAIATLLGTAAAYAVGRWAFRSRSVYLGFVLLPPCVPLIILALIMLLFLRQIGIAKTLTSIVICHITLTAPFAFGITRLRLAQLQQSLEEAAWNLGASQWTAIRTIVLPRIAPAVAAAFLLCMAVSWDEFTVAWFVSGLDVTLPVYLWNKFQGQISAVVNAIGTVSFAVSVVLVVTAEALAIRIGRRAISDPLVAETRHDG